MSNLKQSEKKNQKKKRDANARLSNEGAMFKFKRDTYQMNYQWKRLWFVVFIFIRLFFLFRLHFSFLLLQKKTHAIRFIVATMTENKRIEKFKFKIDVVGALVQQCNKFITERNSIVHFLTHLQLRDHSSQCQCGMKARRLTLHSYIFRKQLAVHYSMWRSLSLTRIAEREN